MRESVSKAMRLVSVCDGTLMKYKRAVLLHTYGMTSFKDSCVVGIQI
jgi:hypothetical protein